MTDHFFEQLLAIMGISLITMVILQRLRLPAIVAYLLAGCLIGPQVIGWVDQPGDFAFLAEFGVVFLLFSLGLEFSLPKLMALRHSVFGLGSIQVGFCSLVFGLAVWLWGTTVEAAVVIAGALALSSTAIVTRELANLRQVHNRHGQLAIGVLLFQDLAAILLLILVPVLGGSEAGGLWQNLGWALLKGLVLLVLLLGAGKWLLPLLYKEVARARSEEIFVLSTLVIVMLAAWITHSFSLSMALGSFVIGMMLGESPFRHQINSDVRVFKDILLGLFFVTIGMNIEIQLLLDYWPRILMFTLALIAIKAVLITALVSLMGDSKNTALQSGLNLAQAGEFGLALLALGVAHGILPLDQASFITLVASFSMLASPLLIRHSQALSNRVWALLGTPQRPPQDPEFQLNLPGRDHVIIGGFGRVGQTIARMLESNDIDYVAVDHDVDLVSRQRADDHNVLYGDCTNMDILHSCHIDSAAMAILTFRSIDMAKNSIEQIRTNGIRVPIIVRCYENGDFAELISLGADHVIPEMLEASLVISAQVLSLLELSDSDIEQQLARERKRQLQP